MLLYKRAWLLALLLLLCMSSPAIAQPVFEQARILNRSGHDRLIDLTGNTIRVGSFRDSLDIDEDGIPDIFANGGTDIAITSEASDGTLNWIRTAGSNVESTTGAFGIQPTDEAREVAHDREGNLYIGGRFHDAIDFNSDGMLDVHASAPDTTALFIAKYTPSGSFLWATTYGGDNDYLTELEFDASSGTLYMVVVRIAFTSEGLYGPSELMVAGYSPEGTVLKERAIPVSELSPPSVDFPLADASSLQLDSSGNLYVLGRYIHSFGGDTGFFLAKYNPAFEQQWIRKSTGNNETDVLFVDVGDNLWVSGSYYNNPLASFSLSDSDSTYQSPDGLPAVSSVDQSFYLARYTPEGAIGCVRFVQNRGIIGRANAYAHNYLQPFASSVMASVVFNGEIDLDGDGEFDLTSAPAPSTLFMNLATDCSIESTWRSTEYLIGFRIFKSLSGSYRMEGSFRGEQLFLNGIEDEPPVLNPEQSATAYALFAADFTFTDPTLPVELVDFTIVQNKGALVLSWETASELNNAGFEVQQARDGEAWEPVAFINGHGTTDQAQQYTHTLFDLLPGTHQFRLKQVDFDGSTSYSESHSIHIGTDHPYLLGEAYPNPFNPRSTFTLSVAREQEVRVTLYDVTGRLIETLFEGFLSANTTRTFTIDGSRLPSGIYAYRVEGAYFNSSKSVMLIK